MQIRAEHGRAQPGDTRDIINTLRWDLPGAFCPIVHDLLPDAEFLGQGLLAACYRDRPAQTIRGPVAADGSDFIRAAGAGTGTTTYPPVLLGDGGGENQIVQRISEREVRVIPSRSKIRRAASGRSLSITASMLNGSGSGCFTAIGGNALVIWSSPWLSWTTRRPSPPAPPPWSAA